MSYADIGNWPAKRLSVLERVFFFWQKRIQANMRRQILTAESVKSFFAA